MKAIRIHGTGGPEVLQWEDIPPPTPRRGEALVEIHVAGVNPVDAKIRSGRFPIYRPKLPAILGRDVAGVVRDIGKGGARPLKIGDPVFGMLDYERGAYAEYAVASVRELALRPEALPERVAGVLPVAALTAWQGLFDYGGLRSGQRVMIHGASGGVGHLAVQFAAARGATVVATASEKHRDWVRRLGATQVIDYRREQFENETGNIDLVFDLIGTDTQERSWQVLKPEGGILVSTRSKPSSEQARRHHAAGVVMAVQANRRQLGEIARLVVRGTVKVEVEKLLPLRRANEAHALLEHDHGRGKIGLLVRH